MNSLERLQLPSSILHLLLMFKIFAFFFLKTENIFDRISGQNKAAKSEVPNALIMFLGATDPFVLKVFILNVHSGLLTLSFKYLMNPYTQVTDMFSNPMLRWVSICNYCLRLFVSVDRLWPRLHGINLELLF